MQPTVVRKVVDDDQCARGNSSPRVGRTGDALERPPERPVEDCGVRCSSGRWMQAKLLLALEELGSEFLQERALSGEAFSYNQ